MRRNDNEHDQVGLTEVTELMELIKQALEEGVEHGFFEMVIIGERVQGKKCQVTVKAGKSYRRYVPGDGQ
jgi:hypothetical protein